MIVDDCSTDGTFEICMEYARKDCRIKLFRNERNSGIEFSLNRALKESSGKYIARMDGDDISEACRLEKMKAHLDENPDIKLVGTSAITIDIDGNEIGWTAFLNDFDLIKKTCLLKTPVAHIWMTYKEIYGELVGYRTLFATEDYDFVLRLLSRGYICTNLSEYFGYKIRVNRAGNSASTYGVKKLKSRWYTAKLYRERLKSGKDSYSLENCQKCIRTLAITEKLYALSSKFLYKAIAHKSRENFFRMMFFVTLSLISPYQVIYLFEVAKYKRITKRGTK